MARATGRKMSRSGPYLLPIKAALGLYQNKKEINGNSELEIVTLFLDGDTKKAQTALRALAKHIEKTPCATIHIALHHGSVTRRKFTMANISFSEKPKRG